MKKIRLVISDIDGVLTDGKVYFSAKGRFLKSLCLKDFDACTMFQKLEIPIAFVTGERDEFTELVKEKIKPQYFIDGCKNKYDAINKLLTKMDITWDEICYVGDGVYDMEPLEYAGVAVCPADAIEEVKRIEGIHILKRSGGTGCLSELLWEFNKNQFL